MCDLCGCFKVSPLPITQPELKDNTFVGYVNELRLNHAAMLLVTTDSPIIEIASKSGFNNLSNFNRAFKMYFGKTPSTYRKG